MKVLVTGANGFLAPHIIRILIACKYEVRGMMRKNASQKSLEGIVFEKFTGDITNAKDITNAVTGCNVIIHTAADTSPYEGDRKIQHEVNVRATQLLLDEAVRQHIQKFIYVSTANTIGYGSAANPGTEKNPAPHEFLKSGYVQTKLKAQELVLKHAKEKKLNALVVNPSFLIGPFDAKPSSGRILLMYRNNKRIWITGGGKSFIHVRDAATAICNAIELGKKGECYLLTNENLTFHEFFGLVSEVTGFRPKRIIIPGFIVLTGGYIMIFLGKLGFQSEFNLTNVRLLCSRLFYDSSKAVKELKMPQTPVKNAIAEALEWFRNNGY